MITCPETSAVVPVMTSAICSIRAVIVTVAGRILQPGHVRVFRRSVLVPSFLVMIAGFPVPIRKLTSLHCRPDHNNNASNARYCGYQNSP